MKMSSNLNFYLTFIIISLQNIVNEFMIRRKAYFRSFILLVSIGLFTLWISSCKKKEAGFDTSSSLYLSVDTITFDTVFTTIGSSTEYFMIRNKSSKPLNISKIYLAGGQASKFRINIDGLSGVSFTDMELPANDSLYAFVEVTIDPNGGNTPLLVTDSIVFETNGHIQDIDLVAYGQDAYYILPNHHIQGLPPFNIVAGEGVDTTWTNAKPIVVYGYAVVDSTAILRIQEGTKIYFHNNSGLWVYKGGCLKVSGTKDNPVVFQGDRLESYYADVPGQWDRIWLNEGSIDNEINHAVIRNAFIGLQTEILQQDMGNKLVLKNTVIENISGAGLLSRYYAIDAENVVIANCQQYNLALTMGGNYSFKHATLVNYWSYSVRKTPTVYFNNYYKDGNNVVFPFDLTKADFINCIIYGNADDEILADSSKYGGNFNYFFDHCLIKSTLNVNDASHWQFIQRNQDPLFSDIYENDYHITTGSSAIGKGKGGVVPIDIEGVTRDLNTPNLGAFEEVDNGS